MSDKPRDGRLRVIDLSAQTNAETLTPQPDDRLVELELGAVRSLVERLQKLEQAEDCDSCQAQIDALNARVTELEGDVAALKLGVAEHEANLGGALQQSEEAAELRQVLGLLRANGVTRYKRGDDEIELSTAVDAPGSAAPVSDRKARPGPAVAECPSCGEEAPYHRQVPLPTETQQRLDASLDHELERRFGGDAPPGADEDYGRNGPGDPDGAPPVEIDMAATAELIKKQQERRRGE